MKTRSFLCGLSVSGILALVVVLSVPFVSQAQSDDSLVDKAECVLGSVTIALPRNGTTILAPAGAADVPLPIYAATDCLADTKQVEFSFDDTAPVTDTDAPFGIIPASLGDITSGQHTIAATARSIAASAAAYEATSSFTRVQAADSVDSDLNGLPNNPFTALAGNGYEWISEVMPSDTGGSRLTGVARWAGSGGSVDEAPIVVALVDPDNTDRRVIVTMPQSLLVVGETGMLIVVAADTPETLLGTTEAAKLGSEPILGLVTNARYVEVSVIVSADAGVTFSEIASSRLAANPLHLRLEGVTAYSTDYPAFYSHPTNIESNATTGLTVAAEESSWTKRAKDNFSYSTHTIETDLMSLSLVAPFKTFSGEGEGEGEGEWHADPGEITAVFLGLGALVAVIVSGVTDAGSKGGGGGGPCFIATAAFGTPMFPAIDTLRAFRDIYLLDSSIGTAFVDTYYRVSPFLADVVARSAFLALCARMILWPIILLIKMVMNLPLVSAVTFMGTIAMGGIIRRKKKGA